MHYSLHRVISIVFKFLINSSSFSSENVSYQQSHKNLFILGDCLKVLKTIPSQSVSLIVTDPPYHATQKKNIVGDTAFKSDLEYLKWMELISLEWARVLKPNGSFYCFCDSSLAARLEVLFSNKFNILNHIVWTKPNKPGFDGWKGKMNKESLRQWYPHSERIIFAELAQQGNLHRTYFGNYLREQRLKTGLTGNQLTELTGSYGKINRGGAVSNWETGRNIPSKEQFNKIKEVLLSTEKIDSFPSYEDAIRPFFISKNLEYTDVWNFESVRAYKGKHPAEKPLDMLEHIIKSSSYDDDLILDCFSGSGSTAMASHNTNRRCISIEIDVQWYNYAINRNNQLV